MGQGARGRRKRIELKMRRFSGAHKSMNNESTQELAMGGLVGAKPAKSLPQQSRHRHALGARARNLYPNTRTESRDVHTPTTKHEHAKPPKPSAHLQL